MAERIQKGVERGVTVTLTINGQPVTAYEGETLATVLMAAGQTVFQTNHRGQQRAPLCNMGTCFECLVGFEYSIDTEGADRRWVRSCMTLVSEGLQVFVGEEFSPLPTMLEP